MIVQAATMAGGTNNQDRYLIGDNFAMVLDGATSLAGDRSHDPGWFADQLANAIARQLVAPGTLADAVGEAIRDVRESHGLTIDTSPTSTIALARWSREHIETYVLGDSSVVLLLTDGNEIVRTDSRLTAVAPEVRRSYHERLKHGSGFDNGHLALLAELQRRQGAKQNRAKGYWIAGADPQAGQAGFSWVDDVVSVAAVLLLSDGVALCRSPKLETWADLHAISRIQGAHAVLQLIDAAENDDPNGISWPRAKCHDDKTLVVIANKGHCPG